MVRQVLQAIRNVAGSDESRQKHLVTTLESLVEPWLSLASLRFLDVMSRQSLWKSCHRAEQEFFPCKKKAPLGKWLILLIGVAMVLAFLAGTALIRAGAW
jgi:hypothetical protein